jgi:hypothetical protein
MQVVAPVLSLARRSKSVRAHRRFGEGALDRF